MRFAYLNLSNHPRGNVILSYLLDNNFRPLVVVEENSSLAQKNKNGITSFFEGTNYNFLETKPLLEKYNIPLITVDNHNSEECQKILERADLDLIVLGDTRVIKNNIINIPRIGVINSHPGYLPDVRGNNPYIWAIINDLPQGCSVHFIDENVDTGDLLLREKIDPKDFKSFADFLQKINFLCAELILESLKKIQNKSYIRIPQLELKTFKSNHIPKEFYAASTEIKKLAIEKFYRLCR